MANYHIYDNSVLSGGTITVDEWETNTERTFPPSIFRYINNTDVSVDVEAYATDIDDSDHNRLNQLSMYDGATSLGEPIYRRPEDTGIQVKTIPSGGHESYTIREMWDRVVFNITPATEPTSGKFRMVHIK